MVSRGLAPSIVHVDRDWTLAQVLDANEYLDVSDDAERLLHEARRAPKEPDARGLVQPPKVEDAETAADIRQVLRSSGHQGVILDELEELLGVTEAAWAAQAGDDDPPPV